MHNRPFQRSALHACVFLFVLLTALFLRAATESLGQLPPYAEKNKPLHVACAAGDLAQVKHLLARGADINERDSRRDTPLMVAVQSYQPTPHQVELVRCLLEKKADLHLTNASGYTPLMVALNAGGNSVKVQMAIVNLLLARGVNVNAGVRGWTALHLAAGGSHVEVVRRLLQAGANVNARDLPAQWTPLLIACARRGSLGVVNMLLEAGADTKVLNSLHYNALELAADQGNIPVVKVLLRHGFKVEQRGPDGETPLMLAAGGNDLETARFLLQRGANSNDKDKKGNTPLLWAVYPLFIKDADGGEGDPGLPSDKDYRKMARLLLDKGADIHARNKEGKTALMLAKEEENPRLVTFLQDAGAKE